MHIVDRDEKFVPALILDDQVFFALAGLHRLNADIFPYAVVIMHDIIAALDLNEMVEGDLGLKNTFGIRTIRENDDDLVLPDGFSGRDIDRRDRKDFIILKIDAQGRVETAGINIQDPAALAEVPLLEGALNSVVS